MDRYVTKFVFISYVAYVVPYEIIFVFSLVYFTDPQKNSSRFL